MVLGPHGNRDQLEARMSLPHAASVHSVADDHHQCQVRDHRTRRAVSSLIRASILPDGPDMPYDTAGEATLEFERGLFDCTSSCAVVGNFQPNSPIAMTAWVRFDTFSALSIAVT
jgi:hypothetical protein